MRQGRIGTPSRLAPATRFGAILPAVPDPTTRELTLNTPDTPALGRDFWEHRYQSGQTGWDRGAPSPALRQWLEAGGLPTGRALVPGCGRGHEVLALAHAGYAVTAIDLAPSALSATGAQLDAHGLKAERILADVLAWTPAQTFDLIYEQTCLCALDPEHWPAYSARLAHWLRPGGVLAILFMQTGRAGGPPFDCRMARMHELFDASRWQWQDDSDRLTIPHPNGGTEFGYRLIRRA